jgi:tetratricopeptide (TPR) repeat protein
MYQLFSGANMVQIRHLSGAKLTSFTLEELTKAADMLESSGRYEEAIDLYRQWLNSSQDERKHVAWFNFGWLLQKQNLFNDAANAYNQLTDNYANYLSGHATPA